MNVNELNSIGRSVALYRGGDIHLRSRCGIACWFNAFTVDEERNPGGVGKCVASHCRGTVFSKREPVIRHDDDVCILIPVLVFDGVNQS